MFMEIPSWKVTAEHPHRLLALDVSEDDLETVFRTLKRNGYKKISMQMNLSMTEQALKLSEQLRSGK